MRLPVDGNMCTIANSRHRFVAFASYILGEAPDIPRDSYGYTQEALNDLFLNEPLSYPRLPYNPDIITLLSRLPAGFSDLCLSCQISKQMMHLLASINGMCQIWAQNLDHPMQIWPEMQITMVALRKLTSMGIRPLEKQLCSGIMALCFQMGPQRLSLFHDPQLQSFINILATHDKSDSIQEQYLMIWITICVMGALYLRKLSLPNSQLILEQALVHYDEMRDWNNIRPILQTFFCADQFLPIWKQAWETGMERRKPGGLSKSLLYGMNDFFDHSDLLSYGRGAPQTVYDMARVARCPFASRFGQEVSLLD